MKRDPLMMIMDDLEINRKLLCEIFKDDYKIIFASNGIEGWEKLETNDFDVILADLIMPEMDGFEFLKKIKNAVSFSDIPVVVTTSYSDNENQIKAFELGASDFISNPYNPIVVKRRVQNVVQMANINFYRNSTQYDSLTGLYNRATFCSKSAKILRMNVGIEYSIFHIDIENFKVFNEIYGNKYGDQVLVVLAEQIMQLTPENGVCGRLSEDNFVVLIPTNEFTPKAFSKKISNFKSCGLHDENVSIRLGVFHIKNADIPVDHMCDRASLAAHYAKERSLKIGIYNEELRSLLIKEQEVVRDFDQAMENGEFTFYLQPIYSVISSKIISAEALARWIKNGTVISPIDFIPILEKRGYIFELDLYIFEMVCKYLASQIKNGEKIVPISVNLSRVTLINKSIFSSIKKIVNKYNIDFHYLRFEITESAYISNPELIIEFVKIMQQNNFKIYMDDFGSGYSSLNMLNELPVDVLKIDMRFIQNVGSDKRTENIYASVTKMAKWMNMRLIAEGVETQSQIYFLKTIGCEFVQGYFYSKPISIADFSLMINSQNENDELTEIEPPFSDLINAEVWGMGNSAEIQNQNKRLNDKINLYADIMAHGTKTFIFELNVSNDEAKCYDFSTNRPVVIFTTEKFLLEINNTRKIQEDYIQGFMNCLLFAKQNEIINAYDFLAISDENLVKWYRMVYASRKNENGIIETVIGRIFDVSIHKQSYEDLSKDKPYINALALESLVVFQFSLTEDIEMKTIYYSNDFFQNYLNNCEIDNLSSIKNICHPDDVYRLNKLTFLSLTKYFESGKLKKKKEIRLKNADGNYVWCEIALNKFENFALDSYGIGSIKVIEEQKELEERAKYDYITKLLNRATFENLFDERDCLDDNKTALMLIDVDNFKGINDKYGHLIGDRVLSIIADIFIEITRKSDLVGRLGGDEFVIFMEYENVAEVEALAVKIHEKATKIGKILFGGKDVVTLSAGIALNTFDELDFTKLYDKADKLLYEVKKVSKNSFKIE